MGKNWRQATVILFYSAIRLRRELGQRKPEGKIAGRFASTALTWLICQGEPAMRGPGKPKYRNSRNPTVCKPFDDLTHEVHIGHDTVQFDVFVFTVSAAAANTHCIDGGNTQ